MIETLEERIAELERRLYALEHKDEIKCPQCGTVRKDQGLIGQHCPTCGYYGGPVRFRQELQLTKEQAETLEKLIKGRRRLEDRYR